jgi:hypothetical protein
MIVLNSFALSQIVLDELVFSVKRGFYTDSFTLEISCNTPEALIKYTKDGTDPFTSLTAQSQPSPASINIDPTDTLDRDRAPGVVIRACAVKDGILLTKIATHTYLFLDKIEELSPDGIKPGAGWPDPRPGTQFTIQGMNYGMDPDVLHDPRYQNMIKDALLSIPTISIVIDLLNLFQPDSGIYVNALYHGDEWERRASVELLNPDGSPGFQIDAGLRIRGAWGRTGINFKHALRLFFREEYGEGKLHYPLFGDEGVTEFDNVDLRTAQNYSWAYNGGGDGHRNTELREVFSRDTQKDMGQPYTRSRYYHLYINGTYWGLYQTQERSEASFGESYLGGTKEDYDVVKVDVTDSLDIANYHIEVTDGNLDAYQKLWEKATIGFNTDESYYEVQGLNPDGSRNLSYPVLVDIDNLIDYILCTIYVCDPDGPTAGGIPNNFYGIYNRNGNRGFVFFRHDAEHSLMYPDVDLTQPTSIGQEFRHFNPRWLHQRLSYHPDYRLKFYDHVYKHFFNNGALTLQSCRNRLLNRKAQIDNAIIAESARWGDAYSSIPRTRDGDWLPEVNWILDQFFPPQVDVMLQRLRNQELYPNFNPPVFNLTSGRISKGTVITVDTTGGPVYYTLDGNDTHMPSSLQKASQTILVPRNAAKRVLIPTASVETRWRYDVNFADSLWLLCNNSPGGIGYDLGPTYDDMISFDVESQMHNVNSTCLIRIPFEVTEEQLSDFNFLILRIQYDDGFIAYLNKSSAILSRNAPGTVAWKSSATTSHDGKIIESFDITTQSSKLVIGRNLLAIQVLNTAPGDSDIFISVELVIGNTMKSSGPISPSAFEYTAPITIDHTTKFKARTYKDGQWSALNEVSLWVVEGNDNLKITEIHYHPLDGEVFDEKEYEFIEFKNVGTESLDLSGLTFTDGIDYTFPSGTIIASGAYLVLASNAQIFETRYQFAPFGEFNGQLNNGGDTLVLETSTGDTIINFTYDDDYPWPNSPDGSGYSLIRKPDRIFEDPNDPTCWCASQKIHGNPGAFDVVGSVDAKGNNHPISFQLYQNYPNPFNPSTTISFSIPSKSFVTLKVYDLIGRELATLVSEELPAGNHSRQWIATGLSSGVYFYRLQTASFTQTRKLILLR